MLVALSATGCLNKAPDAQPSIEFTVVPPAAVGGSDRTAAVSGRVNGARAGQRIVLYAKSGVWWVQPLTAEPFTTIAADRTWRSTIHLGTEYAALLVDAGYRPADTTDALPQPGAGVVAVASVKGGGDVSARPRKVLNFSGYDWDVRDFPSDRGGANDYDPDNAWTDAEGFLHLKLANRDGRWSSAEVILTRGLGYGTYAFTVRDVSGLDPAAALSFFTWDIDAVAQNHRELDVEIGQWGDPKIPNAQYVVQPFYVPANVARFSAPPGTLTHAFRWEPGRVVFQTTRGTRTDGRAKIAGHEFTSGVPTPGGERVRMNLYYYRFGSQPPQKDIEIVVERFRYVP